MNPGSQVAVDFDAPLSISTFPSVT
jgi:hypothetical protein